MVQLNSSFPSTSGRPPPFQGWRMGAGFGKVCRSYIQDPTIVRPGRSSPSEAGYYRENRFWLGKWEKDQQSTFGGAPSTTPESHLRSGGAPVVRPKPETPGGGPQCYGDVSKKLGASYKTIVYENMKIKPRFPSIQQKIAANPRFSGPGPAKYDTRFKAGDTGWAKGSKNPKWKMAGGGAREDTVAAAEAEGKPGPGYYNVSGKPGKNYPIKYGTLYDIQHIGERLPDLRLLRAASQPGPGQYRTKSIFD